jgi:hypothetical protein
MGLSDFLFPRFKELHLSHLEAKSLEMDVIGAQYEEQE